MDDELRSHIEIPTQENIDAGMRSALCGAAAVRVGGEHQGEVAATSAACHQSRSDGDVEAGLIRSLLRAKTPKQPYRKFV